MTLSFTNNNRRARKFFFDNKTGNQYINGTATNDQTNSDNIVRTVGSSSGGGVSVRAAGQDTNIKLTLSPKGSGDLEFLGTGKFVLNNSSYTGNIQLVDDDILVNPGTNGGDLTFGGGAFTFAAGTYNTSLTIDTATANRTITFPDATGTVALTSQLDAKIDETASTGSAVVPSGTTAQRDVSPNAGYLRFNTTDSSFEGYDGSAWGAIGGGTNYSVASDEFDGDGSTTAFTLSRASSTNAAFVALNGIVQEGGIGKSYTVSNTTLTFATAPAVGERVVVRNLVAVTTDYGLVTGSHTGNTVDNGSIV